MVAFAGDGGTYDIGIQSLSGALERGTDFIYVCYDNEGYMNTGTQRSSASPAGAITSTTPILSKLQHKKDMIRIVEAHRIRTWLPRRLHSHWTCMTNSEQRKKSTGRGT